MPLRQPSCPSWRCQQTLLRKIPEGVAAVVRGSCSCAGFRTRAAVLARRVRQGLLNSHLSLWRERQRGFCLSLWRKRQRDFCLSLWRRRQRDAGRAPDGGRRLVYMVAFRRPFAEALGTCRSGRGGNGRPFTPIAWACGPVPVRSPLLTPPPERSTSNLPGLVRPQRTPPGLRALPTCQTDRSRPASWEEHGQDK